MPASSAGRASLADRLHSLAIHLLRAVRSGDDVSGLSGPRLSALSVIIYAGPISLTDLAAAEHVTSPTMTRLVQALEAGGFVHRSEDPDDRRAVKLAATARGRKALDAARARRLAAMEQILDGVSAEDLEAIERAVTVLEERVKSS